MNKSHQTGFALPTVLISSLVMFGVLLAAAAVTATSRAALSDQYYNRLAKQAAESGLAYAEACLDQLESIPDWSDGNELKPHTDCSGNEISGASMHVVDTDKIKSRFTVGSTDAGDGYVIITSEAEVDILRASNGTPWKSFYYVAKTRITPGVDEVGFRQISTGSSYSCTIATNDAVYCWGQGLYGRLGIGDLTEQDKTTPVAVDMSALEGESIAQLSAGDNHACLLTVNNEIYCWGRGDSGQLGNASTSNQHSPVLTATTGSMAGKTPTQVVAGFRHTCALASDNTVHCWGMNTSGQLGTNNTTSYSAPRAVSVAGSSLDGKTVTQLAAGVDHTCALASDGTVHCWGAGGKGQLGRGSTSNSYVPAQVSTSTSLAGKAVVQIGVGGDTSRDRRFSCALASDGSLHCWGEGTYGRIGDGAGVTRLSPVAVVMSGALAGKTATSLSVGADHSCVIASDGAGYCWGRGSNGRLGNNSADTQSTPDAVDMTGALAGKDLIQISAGDNHTCALASDNTAYCWGVDTNGRLGHGNPLGSHQFFPAPVRPLPIDVMPGSQVQF